MTIMGVGPAAGLKTAEGPGPASTPGSSLGLKVGIAGGGRWIRVAVGSVLGLRLLTTGITLARSLARSGPEGGRAGTPEGPA